MEEYYKSLQMEERPVKNILGEKVKELWIPLILKELRTMFLSMIQRVGLRLYIVDLLMMYLNS